jgi:hypothetical protein
MGAEFRRALNSTDQSRTAGLYGRRENLPAVHGFASRGGDHSLDFGCGTARELSERRCAIETYRRTGPSSSATRCATTCP